jgi:hypothetical protein
LQKCLFQLLHFCPCLSLSVCPFNCHSSVRLRVSHEKLYWGKSTNFSSQSKFSSNPQNVTYMLREHPDTSKSLSGLLE